MRRTSILALLLVVLMNTMAAACVSDLSGIGAPNCIRKGKRPGKVAQIRTGGCNQSVKRAPDTCHVRGFRQYPIGALSCVVRHETTPATRTKIEAPGDPNIVSYSLGPSQTDRGPPRS